MATINKRTGILRLLIVGVVVAAIITARTFAANASISPIASSRSVTKGATVTISVKVDTGGSSTNAYEATVSVPTDRFTIKSVSKTGSICQLWVSDPSFNAGSGTAHFECGTPANYNGGSGTLGTITLEAKTVGVGTVSVMSPSQILASDGAGTNILSGLGSVAITVNEPLQRGPTISSTTHPDQTVWYKTNTFEASWTGSGTVSGYGVIFNQSPSTAVQTQTTTDTTARFENVADGTWYLHVGSRNGNVWSAATHYKVMIDTVAPEAFTPVVTPEGVIEIATPTVTFATNDATSGIRIYQVSVDDGKAVIAESPYVLPTQSSGKHVVNVRAIDQAGNETIGSAEFTIIDIEKPTVSFDRTRIILGEQLIVSGTTFANGKVDICLDTTDDCVGDTVADENGNFSYTFERYVLLPPKHNILVAATDPTNSLRSEFVNVGEVEVSTNAVRFVGIVIGYNVIVALLGAIVIATSAVSVVLYMRLKKLTGTTQS